MTRKFFAILLSATIATTSIGAAPVQAGDRDAARAIAGIAAIAILGAAIHESQRGNRAPQQTHGRPHRQPQAHQPQRQHRARAVPASCLVDTRVNRQRVSALRMRCVDRNVRGRAPQSCVRRTTANHGPRYVYGKRCMRNNGYVVARR
ncbi:hypothetical protein [Pseudooceanicola aestuarii]|uniref:hypothetical protein n=1 Tax=Pseudooceanicola aestuarii TaxID=2697319 RepID=UPI0013D47181|nr:hypothetical protein [Pseudooceanicola aestuarii]